MGLFVEAFASHDPETPLSCTFAMWVAGFAGAANRTMENGTMTPLDADVLQNATATTAYMLREVELPCKYRCVYAAASVTTVVGWRSGESRV